MPIPPASIPRSIPPLLALLCFIFSCHAQAQSTTVPSELESAGKDYRTFLKYHIARIDGKWSPLESSRPAKIAHAAELKPAVDKLDLERIRTALKPPSLERSNVTRLIRGYLDSIPSQLLQAEAKYAGLNKRLEDDALEEDQKPLKAAIDRIGARISWLQKRQEFLSKELASLKGKATAADNALETYLSLLTLEDAKLRAAHLISPRKKSHAEATVKVLSEKLEGKTVAGTRAKLPREQLDRTIGKLATLAKPLLGRLRSPSNASADNQNYLTALLEFYRGESVALEVLFTESQRLSKPAK
ncbi:MAG: hypothetical protein ACI9UA_001054 [Pseudoalteromonas tetraodonis]|jgi:hypothetical protein